MKLVQLEYVIAIVEKGSLGAAARHLGVPQPVLTRGIHALEHELDAPLFVRQPQGMVLTPAGDLFHQRISAMVNDLRRAKEEIAQSRGGTQGTVAVGMSIAPHIAMLPHALPQFLLRYPGVKLKIVEGLFPAVEGGLRDGSIDFYLGALPHDETRAQGMVTELLYKSTSVVVGRINHPLAGAKSLKELAGAQWATTPVDYDAPQVLNALFAKYGMGEPTRRLQFQSTLTVMAALACSDLLTILPAQWSELPMVGGTFKAFDIQERLLAPPIVCIRRPDLPLTPAAEYFCDLLRRYTPESA
jgi:LysR family transcriptional regulator, regulator of abg operon